MNITTHRHWVNEDESERWERERALSPKLREFACRYYCRECGQALTARYVADMMAVRKTTHRRFCCLLTYSDEALMRLDGSCEAAHSIRAALPHFAPFIKRWRDALRRAKPELTFLVEVHRVAEYGGEKKRVHWHVAIDVTIVGWAEPLDHFYEPLPVWSDDWIPYLRVDELFVHEWETREQVAARRGRERSKFPSRLPWPYGYMTYTDPRGGEQSYFAKYCSKSIEHSLKLQERRRAGDDISQEDYDEDRRLWESRRSIRRSPRYGHRFYAQLGRDTAEQGLPPTTIFSVKVDARVIEGSEMNPDNRSWGSDSWVKVELVGEDEDGLLVSVKEKPTKAFEFMLTGGAARAYLRGYDDAWAAKYGDKDWPVAQIMRQAKVLGNDPKHPSFRQYWGYGVDEAWDAATKYALRQVKQKLLKAAVLAEMTRRKERKLGVGTYENAAAGLSSTDKRVNTLAVEWRDRYARGELSGYKPPTTRWDGLLDRAFEELSSDRFDPDRFEERFGPLKNYARHWRERRQRRDPDNADAGWYPQRRRKGIQALIEHPWLVGWDRADALRLAECAIDARPLPWSEPLVERRPRPQNDDEAFARYLDRGKEYEASAVWQGRMYQSEERRCA